MKKIAVSQSNYLPWKGYFDLIAYVDEFVIYDEVQFTKQDWRNRNLIKTPHGPKWISVPVENKGRLSRKISETKIIDDKWHERHLRAISLNYAKSPYFGEVMGIIEPILTNPSFTFLSDLNRRLISAICLYLDIRTTLLNSIEYTLDGDKNTRLVSLCEQVGAEIYVSAPAAKVYLDEMKFLDHGIKCEWFDYCEYPAYPQLWGEFDHQVTILDLLFNCGRDASQYMKYVQK